ncbi:MAG: hypothetical protein ABGY24_05480 [bacterium]
MSDSPWRPGAGAVRAGQATNVNDMTDAARATRSPDRYMAHVGVDKFYKLNTCR